MHNSCERSHSGLPASDGIPQRVTAHPPSSAGRGCHSREAGSERRSGKSSSRYSPDRRTPVSSSAERSSTRRILPEIVFGSSPNSIRRTRLYGASPCAAVPQDPFRGLRRRLPACGQHHVRLGDREPQPVRRRHDRRLRHRRVLDQHALQLERGDPVVRGLEDVVRAPDVRDRALLGPAGHVTGVVVAVGQRVGDLAGPVPVAGHQAEPAGGPGQGRSRPPRPARR